MTVAVPSGTLRDPAAFPRSKRNARGQHRHPTPSPRALPNTNTPGELPDPGTGWHVRDGVLLVVGESGEWIPDADAIFAHALRRPDPGLPPLPADVPGEAVPLVLSRYPVELRLEVIVRPARIEGSPESGGAAQPMPAGPEVGAPVPVAAVTALMDGGRLCALSQRQLAAGHLVHEGTWYPLVRDDADAIAALLTDTGTGLGDRLTLRQYLELRKRVAAGSPLIADLTGEALAAGSDCWEVSDAPAPIGGLYPYQETGVRWLRFVREEGIGGILADEMGLGKTVQIIALLLSTPLPSGQPALVVGTTSILENWRRELARFAPGLRVLVHRGAERTGFPATLREADVVVTSYDVMVRDHSLLRQIEWTAVILDEAQAIKNPQAQRTRAAKRLRRQVSLAVTGTPLENRLTDLWSLTDFVVPGLLGDAAHFERTYVASPDGAGRVGALIAPLMLRRRVAAVATDLPPRLDIPQPLEMPSGEAAQYEHLRAEIEASTGSAMSLAALTRLRMLCTHPALVGMGGADPVAASQKYERLVEILEEVRDSGEKALVFTAYTGMIDLMLADLPLRLGVPSAAIDGRTAPEARQDVVDTFARTPGPGLLVLNPRAAGVGLNITAATHVIHYTLEWNPAVEDQASARAYRRGQTRPVTVHRLFYVSTVEEVIDQRLQRKRALAETAVTGTDGSADDYEDLLRAIRASPALTRTPDER